jgi:hypothetical protein
MNRLFLSLAAAAVFGGLALAATPASAQYGARQYYGQWQSHQSGYAYRCYYYKPQQEYNGYHHHYVIQHPSYPDYQYYYNPYKKQYWGRCPINYGDKPVYSMLAEKDRGPDLAKIPQAAFPPPGPVPPIPESTDGAKLDLPPDDLPDLSQLPGAAAALAAPRTP